MKNRFKIEFRNSTAMGSEILNKEKFENVVRGEHNKSKFLRIFKSLFNILHDQRYENHFISCEVKSFPKP
jgi:hypothetical protein